MLHALRSTDAVGQTEPILQEAVHAIASNSTAARGMRPSAHVKQEDIGKGVPFHAFSLPRPSVLQEKESIIQLISLCSHTLPTRARC